MKIFRASILGSDEKLVSVESKSIEIVNSVNFLSYENI